MTWRENAVPGWGSSVASTYGAYEYALAGELAGLIEWLEVTGPPGVRDHLASIGNALVERYG
jgi:hypothetical protein